MDNNHIDLTSLTQTFSELLVRLEQSAPADFDRQEPANSPRLLAEAMSRVLQMLEILISKQPQRFDADDDIHQLGDYGLNLLADLSSLASKLGQDDLSRELEGLTFPFALWIARHGATLRALEPVVNTISRQANSVREPIALEQLYELTGEIQDATALSLQQDQDKSNPGRAWRILLLNRAIIATRSHRPELIEVAYDNLLRHLPEEAPRFFREGMQQMDALNYPQPVRNVVEKYYQIWSVARTLH